MYNFILSHRKSTNFSLNCKTFPKEKAQRQGMVPCLCAMCGVKELLPIVTVRESYFKSEIILSVSTAMLIFCKMSLAITESYIKALLLYALLQQAVYILADSYQINMAIKHLFQIVLYAVNRQERGYTSIVAHVHVATLCLLTTCHRTEDTYAGQTIFALCCRFIKFQQMQYFCLRFHFDVILPRFLLQS